MLENWLAKPFLNIAREDCYITPHGFSYSVLPRIAWGLMFELPGRSMAGVLAEGRTEWAAVGEGGPSPDVRESSRRYIPPPQFMPLIG